MKRLLAILAVSLAAVGVLLAVSFFAPLPIPYHQDFSVMYFTDKGLLNGIHIYDYPAQLDFVKKLTSPEFTFHPYPYPPWYALATIYLGWLPIQVAARIWFFMNLAMIGGASWLLTPGWKPILRILAAFAAIMFIPAFGLLIVGQYSAPVLLGAALFIYSTWKKSAELAAIGLLLMTFKPHIGGILFLAGLGWLLVNSGPPRSPGLDTTVRTPVYSTSGRRAIWLTIIGGVVLAGLGFLADPAWPQTYFQSLARYRDIPGVQTCGLCASLSVAFVRVASGQSNTGVAAWVSLVLALGAGILLFWRYSSILKNPITLTVLSAILTLLLDPYLLNYDYILLLIPLLLLIRRDGLSTVAYFIPWAALALGRDGNILLPISALLLLTILLKKRDEFVLSGS